VKIAAEVDEEKRVEWKSERVLGFLGFML